MTTATAVRVLPADVYDTLELVALAYGGIGAGPFFDVGDDWELRGRDCPRCAHGMAMFVDDSTRIYDNGLSRALWRDVHMGAYESDYAVRAINRRLGAPTRARVPFALWCEELGIVRGNSSSEAAP